MRITLKSHVLFCLLALPLLTSACVLGDGFDEDALFEDPIEDEVIEPEEEFTPTPNSSAVTRPEGLHVYEPENNQPRTRAVGGEDLLLLEDATLAVASDASTDALYFVDVRGGSVSATALFEEGANPGRISSSQEGVYVVLRDAGEVALVGFDGVIKERVAACPAPRGVAMDTTREKVWVSCASSELVSFSPATLEKLDTFYIDADLRDVVANQKGLYVSRFRAAEVLSINPERGTIRERMPMPSVTGADSTLALRTINSLWRMTQAGDGDLLMTYQQTTASRLNIVVRDEDDTSSGGFGNFGGYYGGSFGGCGGGVLSTGIVRVDVDEEGVLQDHEPSCVNVGALPVDVDENSCGGFTVLAASPRLGAVRGNGLPTQSDFGCAPHEPTDPLDTRLAIAFGQDSAGNNWAVTMARSQELYLMVSSDSSAARRVVLDKNSAAHVGHVLFHGDTGFGVACASCHPEGGDDGHAWEFTKIDLRDGGSTLDFTRRTQNLRGGVEGKLHWTGEFENMEGLMTDVFGDRMGGFTMHAQDTAAIDDWLEILEPEVGMTLPPGDRLLLERGQELYTSTGCAGCHSGAMLTDYKLYDVGTNGMRKTPTLRGIAQRRRLMSDGCGESLEDRFFAPCGGDAHGDLSDLGEQDQAALIAYLKTL